MSDKTRDRSAHEPPSPTVGADRRPWTAPVLVDHGSILNVVRSTTGPVTDGILIGMMPGKVV